jgi:hypothetical protein
MRPASGLIFRVGFSEVSDEEFLALAQAFLGQRYGLCFSDGIMDQIFFVETVQCVPIMSLPSAIFTVEREKEEGQHHVVDLVFVVIHDRILHARVRDATLSG